MSTLYHKKQSGVNEKTHFMFLLPDDLRLMLQLVFFTPIWFVLLDNMDSRRQKIKTNSKLSPTPRSLFSANIVQYACWTA